MREPPAFGSVVLAGHAAVRDEGRFFLRAQTAAADDALPRDLLLIVVQRARPAIFGLDAGAVRAYVLDTHGAAVPGHAGVQTAAPTDS